MSPVQNKTMIDAGLKKAGFGGLNDPRLFDQIAFVISGKSEKDGHARFRSMLLAVEPEERRKAYQAIAPKLRFRAHPLEDYERQGAVIADQNQLPSYDPATLEVKDWRPQEITTQEYVHNFMHDVESGCLCTHPRFPREDCPQHGEGARFSRELHDHANELRGIQSKLEKQAEAAISKDLREEGAKGQLVLVCRRCTREQTWRGKRRKNMLKLARQEGWHVTEQEVLCMFCKPKLN